MTHNLINFVQHELGMTVGDFPTLTVGTSGTWGPPDTIWVYPEKIEREFDRTLKRFWDLNSSQPYVLDAATLPKTNITEFDDKLVFECFIPFATKDEVKVTLDPLTNGVKVEVEAHQESEKTKGVSHLKEISRSSFKRTFAIDKKFDVKKATGDFENCVLTVSVPVSKDAKSITLEL